MVRCDSSMFRTSRVFLHLVNIDFCEFGQEIAILHMEFSVDPDI